MKNELVHNLTVFPHGLRIKANDGATLLDVLRDNGIFISAFCGGNGTCGKCMVKILDGKTDGSAFYGNGYVLSCAVKVRGDLIIEIPSESQENLSSVKIDIPHNEQLSGAIDIGTTVISAKITSENGEKVYSELSCMNPQCVFGADVLSRISACRAGKLPDLQRLITGRVREMILDMTGGKSLKKLYIAANTTMLHIFLGIDPTSIGSYPFTPVFTETKRVKGEEVGIPADEIYLLASASAYIGADVISGAVFLNMHNEKNTVMLVDIGTNGEILLAHKGKLYATSSAAGPALEGASIECGVGGVSGAIDSLKYENGVLNFTTVNVCRPIGICGSGLIDLVAILIEEGIIDETGAFNHDSHSPLLKKLSSDRFSITDGIYLSAGDIRQIQHAKVAISAAIEALLDAIGINESEISKIYIAGGLGNYMNIKNAHRIGLLPKAFDDKTITVGNTALAGALLACKSPENVNIIEALSGRIEIIELSFSDVFRKKYVDNMYF